MANEDLIVDFERLFEQVDTGGRPELPLMARWFCFTLRRGHSERAEAGATMLTAIRMLALAAEKPVTSRVVCQGEEGRDSLVLVFVGEDGEEDAVH